MAKPALSVAAGLSIYQDSRRFISMANVFLSSGGSFILGSTAKVYGSSGSENVAIQNGLTGIQVDQNVESVALMGNSADYLYQQAGNQLKIFTAASQLICSTPLQGDTDGTRFVFANGSVYGKLTTGVMSFGGTTVGSSFPVPVNPGTIDNSVGNSLSGLLANIVSSEDPATVNVFLDSGDQFVSGSVASAYGSSGVEKVRIQDGVTGFKVDQNVEHVILAGNTGDYLYQQGGNQLKVYTGSVLACTIPLQGDADGTQIVFANGSVSAKLAAGVMSFGGTTVSSSAPGSLIPATIDTGSTSADIVMSAVGSENRMDNCLANKTGLTDIHLELVSPNLLSHPDIIHSTGGDVFAGTSVTLAGVPDGHDMAGFI